MDYQSGKFTGGEALKKRLAELAENLTQAATLRMGFLAGSDYEDGTSLPMIAAVHEFGGKINHPGGTRYITDAVVGRGDKRRLATRFVGKDFKGETKVTQAHVIDVPARPFFRPMIAKCSPGWGEMLAGDLKRTNYNAKKSLAALGIVMEGQLQQSIKDVTEPPLAASTIRKRLSRYKNRKGASATIEKPLIDTAHMIRSARSEVSDA